MLALTLNKLLVSCVFELKMTNLNESRRFGAGRPRAAYLTDDGFSVFSELQLKITLLQHGTSNRSNSSTSSNNSNNSNNSNSSNNNNSDDCISWLRGHGVMDTALTFSTSRPEFELCIFLKV